MPATSMQVDQACGDLWGQRWAILSTQGCHGDGNGTAPVSDCPAYFGSEWSGSLSGLGVTTCLLIHHLPSSTLLPPAAPCCPDHDCQWTSGSGAALLTYGIASCDQCQSSCAGQYFCGQFSWLGTGSQPWYDNFVCLGEAGAQGNAEYRAGAAITTQVPHAPELQQHSSYWS